MATINQIENTEKTDINVRAKNLIKDTKILNITRLAKMLVDLYGQDEPFKKVGKYEGKEIELYLKELDGYITFILTTDRNNFNCHAEKAIDPVARIFINVKEEKILTVISSIIRSKSNIFGLAKLLKYIIPGKAKIKGSYSAAIRLVRCLMIGKHEMYKMSK
ncbi:MAG: hypothetical protein HWN81_06655 [Candidatus Lokiarchaeota archaeon]|nr:hypothetical protein [Candidatus Lokiarchaeota archaeon]